MLFIENKNKKKTEKKGKKKTFHVIVGIYLCTFIALHGYFSVSKTIGPRAKVDGSEFLL